MLKFALMTETSSEKGRILGTNWGGFVITMRQYSGWTQEELARELGVTQQSIARWEQGENLHRGSKALVAGFFGLTPTETAQLNDGVEIVGQFSPDAGTRRSQIDILGAFITRIENGPPLNEHESEILRDLADIPRQGVAPEQPPGTE